MSLLLSLTPSILSVIAYITTNPLICILLVLACPLLEINSRLDVMAGCLKVGLICIAILFFWMFSMTTFASLESREKNFSVRLGVAINHSRNNETSDHSYFEQNVSFNEDKVSVFVPSTCEKEGEIKTIALGNGISKEVPQIVSYSCDKYVATIDCGDVSFLECSKKIGRELDQILLASAKPESKYILYI